MKTAIKILIPILLISALSLTTGCVGRTSSENTEEEKSITWYEKNAVLRYPTNEDGKFRYALYDVCAVILQCLTSEKNVVIPATFNGVPVVKIEQQAFAGNRTMETLTLGPKLLSVKDKAFRDCTALTSVTMSGSVTEFGSGVFQGCTSLKSIIVPAQISRIPSYFCSGCTSLTRVIIEPSPDVSGSDQRRMTKQIDSYAFTNCTNLRMIWIPDDVTVIGSSVFSSGMVPIIFGTEKSAAARFATEQFLNFVVTTREGFDTISRKTKNQTFSFAGKGVGETVQVDGQFNVTVTDVRFYQKIGSVTAEEDEILVALYLTIHNISSQERYFDGITKIHLASIIADPNAYATAYHKMPVFVSAEALGKGFPSVNLEPGTEADRVVVVKVKKLFDAVRLRIDGATSDFAIMGNNFF